MDNQEDMAAIVNSDSQQEQKDLETAQKLKPALGNFVVKEQYKAAEENAKKNKERADKIMLTPDEIKIQCARLSMKAFFDLKLWAKFPPPLEMAWVTGKTLDGRTVNQEQAKAEMNIDISGFSSFLLREYYDMIGLAEQSEYPHPLQEKNLEWFWQKFCSDLALLIKVDGNLQAMGNQGVVSGGKDETH